MTGWPIESRYSKCSSTARPRRIAEATIRNLTHVTVHRNSAADSSVARTERLYINKISGRNSHIVTEAMASCCRIYFFTEVHSVLIPRTEHLNSHPSRFRARMAPPGNRPYIARRQVMRHYCQRSAVGRLPHGRSGPMAVAAARKLPSPGRRRRLAASSAESAAVARGTCRRHNEAASGQHESAGPAARQLTIADAPPPPQVSLTVALDGSAREPGRQEAGAALAESGRRRRRR